MKRLFSFIALSLGLLISTKLSDEAINIKKYDKDEEVCAQQPKISPLELYLLDYVKKPFCEGDEIRRNEIEFYENSYNFKMDDKILYETPLELESLDSKISISNKGILFVIDKSRYMMFLYQVSNEDSCPTKYKLAQIFPVSGGRKYKETPSGLFKLGYREKAFLRFKDYRMGKYSYSLIGLNSNENWFDYKIHGTNEPWLIGKGDYSHGCVRLFDSDIIKLSEDKYFKKGTIILVANKLNF